MTRIAIAYILIFAAVNFAFITPMELRHSKSDAPTLIDWEEQDPLTWNDFKGKAKDWGSVSALTASAIEYAYDCDKGKLNLSVKAIFIPEESWAKSDAKNEYILSHEQLHFDITEVYARKLRKELAARVNSCYEVRRIDGIARKVLDEWKVEQAKYDKDTGHSIHKDLQELWHKKIDRKLEYYADYSLENWENRF